MIQAQLAQMASFGENVPVSDSSTPICIWGMEGKNIFFFSSSSCIANLLVIKLWRSDCHSYLILNAWKKNEGIAFVKLCSVDR